MPNHNAAMGDVTLLYQDEHLVAADTPAGLLAVPGRGDDKQDCLWARVRAQVPDALIVHRLDMATSGLMLFGCGAQAQRQRGAQARSKGWRLQASIQASACSAACGCA